MNNEFDQFLDENGNLFFDDDVTLVDYVERNVIEQAETLAYSIDKLITENDEKLPEDVKTEVKADVDALKTALAGEDDEAVKTAFDKLNQSQSRIGEAIYASSQADAAAGASTEGDAPAGDAPSSDEDVIDAEVVDDEEGKK